MENNSIVRYVIGSSRIKYEVLNEICKPINPKKYQMCCMLIDAHAIFDRLYRPDNINLIDTTLEQTVADIVINLMNVIGHYRRYIATRFQLDNDIFVSYNREPPRYQTELFPMFYEKRFSRRYDDKYKFITNAIDQAWSFICMISNYFEGIYCIDLPEVDEFATLVKASDFDKLSPAVLKLVFAKNPYSHQILRDDRTFIISEKRDYSVLLSRENYFNLGITKDIKNRDEIVEFLTPNILPIIWTMCGLKECSVGPSPFVKSGGPNGICKIAVKIMKHDRYNADTISLKEFLRVMPDYYKIDYIQIAPRYPTLERRYRVLDYRLAAAAITPSQYSKIRSQLIDLFDENELEKMNELLADRKVDPELFELMNLNMSYGEKYN